MKLGDKLNKKNYVQGAVFCNKNGYVINEDTWIIEEGVKAPEPTYAEKRAMEYPAVAEQLDMMFHDMIDGTSVWLDTIRAVKAKYPKG